METKLKEITFAYDEEKKELWIIDSGGNESIVPKKYLFSLNRFLVRIFQRGFYRKRK